MTSRERILAAWTGKPADHIPLTTWAFGLTAPDALRWEIDGVPRRYWYTGRLEHLHTLPQPWTVEDDFCRVLAWRKLGVDDIIDVSVPWSNDPEVTWKDTLVPTGKMDPQYPVMIRDYQTPSGPARHVVRKTGEDPGAGWVIQPDCVPLIEDYNIPRAVRHIVTDVADLGPLKHLYCKPSTADASRFQARMQTVRAFAEKEGVPVQAWAGFGMDAVVWFCGTEGAVLLAMDYPKAFGNLIDLITECDLARVELAATTPGVDMVCERGWYSSTDFWSPTLFDEFLFPHIQTLAGAAHRHGKLFGYVMTTGVETLGPRLADAGVDVLYFVDPIQDRIPLARARDLLGSRITLVGGTNALSVQTCNAVRIRHEVQSAIETLGPTNRFILHPIDALFPDTPWAGIEMLIDAWKTYR
jgi:uroporphyrinogen-III decarboxylase